MSRDRNRRLAAIMFADMVGYTALMQEDEARAKEHRDRYREVVSSAVLSHFGEIVQHYGDGTLCVFDSAVEAVECAVGIQLELRRGVLGIPVRIGVHTGDIVRDREGVFGDGVNVAARIEALSPPGGVLVSEKVFDEIKNHASLSAVLLTEARLKNVKVPVKIFGLVNPGLAIPTAAEVRERAGQAVGAGAGLQGGASEDAGGSTAPAGFGEALLHRVKERAMVPWGLAYLAGAWAITQIVAFLADQYLWAPLIPMGTALIAFVGFFVVMVVSWFHGEKGPQRVRWTEVLILTLLLVVGGTALAMLPSRVEREAGGRLSTVQGPSGIRDARPSVAVLPFENLSTDEENAYFALGLHDEVMTQLLRISGLRVISRTSVMEYASSRPNVREIARELGVSHVTEATVQRLGERLRVNVQLIDARSDDPIWAEGYDRELSDAFAVQSEIARTIAEALSTTLTAKERGAIDTPPTTSSEAYQFYMQGRDYYLRPGYRQEDFEAAQALFERAIALDPDFALARASLARVHGLMYWEGFDPSPARLDAQRREAEEALRLQPDLPQAHVAVGWVHYVEGDYQAALEEYEAAREGLPNDAEIIARIGYTHRRLGHWPEVFRAFEEAIGLSPRNATLFYDLGGHSFAANRRYAEAVAAYDMALSLAPDLHDAALRKGLIYVHWRGQLDTLQSAIRALPADLHLPEVDLARVDMALWERKGDELLQLLETLPQEVLETQLAYLPKTLYAAWAHQLLGDSGAARRAFDSVRVAVEPIKDAHPEDERILAALGYAYAGLGRQDDAARVAAELRAPALGRTDALSGSQADRTAAEILAQARLPEPCVRHLERVLQGASPVSVHTLRLNPLLDPIRDDPGFQALLVRHAMESGG